MRFTKKAEFGIVIGYLFSLFLIVAVSFSVFYLYQDQLETQDESLRSISEGEIYKQLKSSFSLSDAYFQSNQVQFIIENTADINLDIKNGLYSCFEIFVNGKYISNQDFSIKPSFSLLGDYSIIEPYEKGILSIPRVSIGDSVKVISCNGVEKEITISEEDAFIFDEIFRKNVGFNVMGSSFSDVYDYQIKLNLNSSDITFSSLEESEIRLVSVLGDYIELDLNFNSYSQLLDESSLNSFTSTLGASSLASGDDPQEFKQGVKLSSLNFDGGDTVVVSSFDALENAEQFTLSFWVQLDQLQVGQILFSHSGIGEIELGNSLSSNPNEIRFEVNGGINRSSSPLLVQNTWTHIIMRFNSGELCLFVDGVEDTCFTESIETILGSSSNIILGSGLDGKLDEVRFYSLALSLDEISLLNKDSLRYRELDFFIQENNLLTQELELWVKMPFLSASRNYSGFLFYDVDDSENLLSKSSIADTFSYSSPKTIGYVLDESQANSQGLSILSLEDSNSVLIGDDSFLLNNKQSAGLLSGVVDLGDEIRSNGLVHIAGDGQGAEMTVPVSWAGTEFYYSGFRNNGDRYCMLSPFGNANVDMRENGVIFNSLIIDSTPTCISQNIGTTNNLAIESDIPILVFYSGSAGVQDPFVFYPATNDPLYGSPSQTMYYAAGPLGASGTVLESSGATATISLGAYSDINDGGNGPDGNTNAFKLTSDNPIGAIQQADGDGSEASVFAPLDEFSTYFGSNHDVSYISVVSNVQDANCSVYDSSDILVDNVLVGTGLNGIFKYNFGVGDDSLYVAGPWTMQCSKPVWPYIENTQFDDDEQNILGYKQMRQYVFPEPQVYLMN